MSRRNTAALWIALLTLALPRLGDASLVFDMEPNDSLATAQSPAASTQSTAPSKNLDVDAIAGCSRVFLLWRSSALAIRRPRRW